MAKFGGFLKLVELICLTLTIGFQKWEFDSNMISKLYYKKNCSEHDHDKVSDNSSDKSDDDDMKDRLTEVVSTRKRIIMDCKRNRFMQSNKFGCCRNHCCCRWCKTKDDDK